jgi:hypothetical protein
VLKEIVDETELLVSETVGVRELMAVEVKVDTPAGELK